MGDPAALKTFRDVIATVRDRIAAAVKEGKSLEEVRASQPSKEFDEKWGAGFVNGEQFVGIVYASLAQAR